jgi:hypothetical protein
MVMAMHMNLNKSDVATYLIERYGPTMSPGDVCKVCVIKRDTLRHWNRKRIAIIKLGHRTVAYRTSDVADLLRSRYRPITQDQSRSLKHGRVAPRRDRKSKYRYPEVKRMLQNAKRELGLLQA